MDSPSTIEELALEEIELEPVPLEPTCFAPTATPAPALLPDLEPHSFEAVVAALTAALPTEALESWIEPTCQVAVEVDVEALDVERFAPPVHEQAVLDAGACRYCRAPSAPGQAFCEHCGMHLERSDASAAALPEAPSVRCRACGTASAGARCPACGDRLP